MASTIGKKKVTKKKTSSFEEKAKSFGSLLGTLIVVLFIQSFFIQGYSTPTGSMLNTILIGDKMFFNQFIYGGSTPRNIPFTEIRLPHIQLPAIREPKRGDIVNFEFPGNREEVEASMKVQYLKRCVGQPGDIIVVKDAILYVNGERFPEAPGMQYSYKVRLDTSNMNFYEFYRRLESPDYQEKFEITDLRQVRNEKDSAGVYVVVPLPNYKVEEFRKQPYVKSVEIYTQPPSRPDRDIFPRDKLWNRDNYGPLRIPVKGDVITLDKNNYIEWDTFIKREGHTFEVRGGDKFLIDGKETNQYTVENNYYFMMGDNRHNSLDSRFWGFVKREAIVGKAWFTYFSWNSEIPFSDFGKLLGSIRWNRIGKPIE